MSSLTRVHGGIGRADNHDPATPHRDAVFAEKTFFSIYDPMRSIRTDDWLYIKSFELCRWSETPLDCLGSGSERELGHRYAGGHPADQLYAVRRDPWGLENRADDPACAAVLADLRARLGAWMRETGDPLLQGPIRSPFHDREVKSLFTSDTDPGEQAP